LERFFETIAKGWGWEREEREKGEFNEDEVFKKI